MMTSKEQVKKSWAVQKIDSIWSNVEWNVAKGKKMKLDFLHNWFDQLARSFRSVGNETIINSPLFWLEIWVKENISHHFKSANDFKLFSSLVVFANKKSCGSGGGVDLFRLLFFVVGKACYTQLSLLEK